MGCWDTSACETLETQLNCLVNDEIVEESDWNVTAVGTLMVAGFLSLSSNEGVIMFEDEEDEKGMTPLLGVIMVEVLEAGALLR